MAKVLITGGTGLVGKHLCRRLKDLGYEVSVLSRNKVKSTEFETCFWDLDSDVIDVKAINSADYIIHLAGINIGEKRWTTKRKQLIVDSRIKSAALIVNNLDKQKNNLHAFITASAIGYYGAITTENIFKEDDPAAVDFLGQTCKKWEEVADKFTDLGIRTVKIRTGIVLTKEGGALSKMSFPVKMGVGSAIGSGKQYLPWIHIDDLCNIYVKAIEDTKMSGAYNAVAPEHLTNLQFTQSIAHSLNKAIWAPNIPSLVMKLIFGKMSEMLLNGSRVSADKIMKTGFVFKFPNLELALRQLKS